MDYEIKTVSTTPVNGCMESQFLNVDIPTECFKELAAWEYKVHTSLAGPVGCVQHIPVGSMIYFRQI